MGSTNQRATAAAYLAEHRMEDLLSDALNAVVRTGVTDLILALGITLRRRAQSAKSHVQVEGALHHAVDAALVDNEAGARSAISSVAQQLVRKIGQKPSLTEMRSLQQTLSTIINDVLYNMPKDPICTIGSNVGSLSGPCATVPPGCQWPRKKSNPGP